MRRPTTVLRRLELVVQAQASGFTGACRVVHQGFGAEEFQLFLYRNEPLLPRLVWIVVFRLLATEYNVHEKQTTLPEGVLKQAHRSP